MNGTLVTAILLGAAVTLCARAGPILLLSRRPLPRVVVLWLGFVPSAIMAAIVAVDLVVHPARTAGGWSVSVLAAAAALAVGLLGRSLFFTVLSGLCAFALFKAVLP
ncbi:MULTISPECIES: AzlD domain-containing protein [Methylobacterium]|jgi:branched-subunit amino acid transport protein|uniref:AzlD domain-containing protein n=1 Tax=Methylobacterium TaxID=407 RepID=UPI0008E9E280|nr:MULTISPECIES: AzlD domain-containing protein [Methylobacterium]MBZ6412891.1 AzlD domain-containing protein [Methylobacterium sp.]MBK3396527.1 AzlD domain-containing protein [Methylobacterium ajmalii]MBK3409176.1 AzlD domain-containing protein [Methylobacterium ajmalii]MBK3421512.1 AzlD domain-containing protein [Methylobacterium ajmalii]SFE96254.1 Branched-chain amino acid transport protein [Methylobacterium sp. yr596]